MITLALANAVATSEPVGVSLLDGDAYGWMGAELDPIIKGLKDILPP